MILILQCIAACGVFTAVMIPTLLKDLLHTNSYPQKGRGTAAVCRCDTGIGTGLAVVVAALSGGVVSLISLL